MLTRNQIKKLNKEILASPMLESIRNNLKIQPLIPAGTISRYTKRAGNRIERVRKKVLYKEYIHSKKWKKRKEAYYKNNKKECALCKSEWRIGLHHVTYKRLGVELDTDLIALCWPCHSDYHEKYGVKQNNKVTHTFIIEEQEVIKLSEITKNF